MSISKQGFGRVNGELVNLYTIEFTNKLKVSVTNYGGIITSLNIPDKYGAMADIVLGFDNLEGYKRNNFYFGAIVGRCANRIARGKFLLEGKEYTVAKNIGNNHLHGGINGFDKVIWQVINILDTREKVELTLRYVSRDGEEGYPGTLTTTITYIFTPASWQICYEATTDKTTILNLTQHSYFNLSGDTTNNILDHELQLMANAYLPVDKEAIPIGKIMPVAGTPFDFTSSNRIGARIHQQDQQLIYSNGYDHCWVLDGSGYRKGGSLFHPDSGRHLELYTTQPGVQFYAGNFLNNSIIGKSGSVYPSRSGLCLETQHFPDAANQPDFPGIELKPGEVFNSRTTFNFSTR